MAIRTTNNNKSGKNAGKRGFLHIIVSAATMEIIMEVTQEAENKTTT
jgi:hypothetical protein